MSTTLFARVARTLYGHRFTAPLAGALDVDQRTVQRWAAGAVFPPLGVWRELARMIDRQHQETSDEISRILGEQMTWQK